MTANREKREVEKEIIRVKKTSEGIRQDLITLGGKNEKIIKENIEKISDIQEKDVKIGSLEKINTELQLEIENKKKSTREQK